MIKRFAVIGNPIAHSLSPMIHQLFSQQTEIALSYEKIKGDDLLFEDQIRDFFNQGGCGLNVTLPYKLRAFAMADIRTPRCELAGAANTLWMDGTKLCADNTDGIGLIRDIRRFIDMKNKTVLVLGAGGAVRGIIYPLLETQPKSLTIANRTHAKVEELQKDFPQINCSSLEGLSGVFDVIINGTAASLTDQSFTLPQEIMSQKPFCYDLAYKQGDDTVFIHYVKGLGCTGVDGLGMLVEQAAEAFYVWNKVMPLTAPVLKLLC